MNTFSSRLRSISIVHLVIMICALAWNGLAYSDDIHNAAARGDFDKVKALSNGSSFIALSKDNNGLTPLHYAAVIGRKDMVEWLLSHKADVNAKDNNDLTPLHYAAAIGLKAVPELLLAHKADVNAKDYNGLTPLHYAANFGRQDVPELLLAYKADINAKDHNGLTPLDYAEATHHKSLAEFLRKNGGH
jgi:ankyrin repeat protein